VYPELEITATFLRALRALGELAETLVKTCRSTLSRKSLAMAQASDPSRICFISIMNGIGANNRRRIILIDENPRHFHARDPRARPGFNRICACAPPDLAEGHYARQPDLARFIIIRENNQFDREIEREEKRAARRGAPRGAANTLARCARSPRRYRDERKISEKEEEKRTAI